MQMRAEVKVEKMQTAEFGIYLTFFFMYFPLFSLNDCVRSGTAYGFTWATRTSLEFTRIEKCFRR